MLGTFAFFAIVFLQAFALFFASHSPAQKHKRSAGTHLWLLLSLITMESVQESTEKLPPYVVMMSLVFIQEQDNCREKVINLQYFLQGRCSHGQRRLCLALCVLFSLYA
jgi:hypothetical protein